MSHLQHNKCVSILNRLVNDAKHVKEDGGKMLHPNGTTTSVTKVSPSPAGQN